MKEKNTLYHINITVMKLKEGGDILKNLKVLIILMEMKMMSYSVQSDVKMFHFILLLLNYRNIHLILQSSLIR